MHGFSRALFFARISVSRGRGNGFSGAEMFLGGIFGAGGGIKGRRLGEGGFNEVVYEAFIELSRGISAAFLGSGDICRAARLAVEEARIDMRGCLNFRVFNWEGFLYFLECFLLF